MGGLLPLVILQDLPRLLFQPLILLEADPDDQQEDCDQDNDDAGTDAKIFLSGVVLSRHFQHNILRNSASLHFIIRTFR